MEADEKFTRRLKHGYRMDPPAYAPKGIAQLMTDCWKHSPKDRPTFRYLMDTIGGLLDPEVRNHYVQLNERYITMNIERNKLDLQAHYFNAMTRTATAAQGFLRSINSVINMGGQQVEQQQPKTPSSTTSATVSISEDNEQQNNDEIR